MAPTGPRWALVEREDDEDDDSSQEEEKEQQQQQEDDAPAPAAQPAGAKKGLTLSLKGVECRVSVQ
jgi:hypothetical protein